MFSNLSKEYNKIVDAYSQETKNSDKKNYFMFYILRPISFFITPLFTLMKISANKITLFRFLCGLLICYLVVIRFSLFYASLYYSLIIILDFVDGNIARLSKSASLFGKMIDGWVDEILNLILYLSISFLFGEKYIIIALIISFIKITAAYSETRFLYLNKIILKQPSLIKENLMKSKKKLFGFIYQQLKNIDLVFFTILLCGSAYFGYVFEWFILYSIYILLFSLLKLLKTFLNSLIYLK